jgi:hypothetical protein
MTQLIINVLHHLSLQHAATSMVLQLQQHTERDGLVAEAKALE